MNTPVSGVIFTALRGLVNDHCYPSKFPQPTVTGPGTEAPTASAPSWPAIRFTIISAFNESTLCGTTGFADDVSDIQIDVVAKTYGAMVTLCGEVDAQLRGVADPPMTRESYFETWDSATKTHRGILTYRAYASEGIGSPS